MRTMMVIAAIGALVAGWVFRHGLTQHDGPVDLSVSEEMSTRVPPEFSQGASTPSSPAATRPLDTTPFVPPIEAEKPTTDPDTWREIFAVGGRLSWAPSGSWKRGAPSGTWHLGPKDLPAGQPTGVRFNRGNLSAQLASVRRFHHWLYVEFNGHDAAPSPGMAPWLETLNALEAVVLRDMNLRDDVLLSLGERATLVHLSFEDSALAAGGLSHLAALEPVYLKLRETDIRDVDLDAVGLMSTLHHLDLSNTEISDAGLSRLGELSGLEQLLLRDTKITGSGLARLDLTALETLDVESSPVDDRLLANLRACPRLRLLTLNETLISGSGLRHLADSKALEVIELEDTPLEGPYDGLTGLAGLPRLRTLLLDDATIDDGAVPYLLGLTQLAHLHLEDTCLSDYALAQLTIGLAPCEIHR